MWTLATGSNYVFTMEPFRRSALVYDLIYEQRVDYDWHADNLRQLILDRSPNAKSSAEMAVGTGQVLSRMNRWFDVVGCDISPDMLAVCRERHPDIDVRLGDYSTIDLGQRFDAVICVFSSIGYVRTVDGLEAAFQNFARHVRPGGVVVVDGWLRPTDAIDGFRSAETFEGDQVTLTRSVLARIVDGETDMLAAHTLITADGIEYFEERHRMGLFDDATYVDALGRAGFADIAVEEGFDARGRFVGMRS